MREAELLNDWLPYRLIVQDGVVKFRWFYAGTKKFTEPFFEESISSCLSLPENRSGSFPITSAEMLIQLADQLHPVVPTAFIYHISRCGSTLLSQMLACDEQNTVLSEVPLLDDVLRLRFRKDVLVHLPTEKLYRAILALIGQTRTTTQQRLFIKTDSWHVLFYDDLREWFPDSLALLLFRSPSEVAASHSRTPAMHAVPGLIEPELFELGAEKVLHMNREEYLEHVLCCYFRKYIGILESDGNAAALNYHSGAWQMMERLFLQCGFLPAPEIAEAMKQRTKFHSKKNENVFTGDAMAGVGYDFGEAEELFRKLQQLNSLKSRIHGT